MECDIPSFYNVTDPVARKPHECDECSAPITKGEKHVKATGCWEGEISTFRQHTLCADACRFIRDKVFDECIPFGALLHGDGAEAWRRDIRYGWGDQKDTRETIDQMKQEKVHLRRLVAKIRARERPYVFAHHRRKKIMEGRFNYVKYDSDAIAKQEQFKAKFEELSKLGDELLVSARPAALFQTKLEEAYMWAGKSIRDEQVARNSQPQHVPERSNV